MSEKVASRRQWNHQDSVLVALCIIGVAVGLVPLLRGGGPSARGAGAGPVLAKVTTVASNVRLRPAATLVWNSAAPLNPAYESDSIFVPSDGSASLQFNDGTELQLDANTLIILEPRDESERPAIALADGSVIGRAGDTGLDIRAPGGRVTLKEKSRVQISHEKKRGTRVQVLEGEARLSGQSGNRVISDRQSGGFEEDGSLAEIIHLPVTLREPGAHARLDWGEDPTRVVMKWQQQSDEQLKLQVSRDPRFKDLAFETPTEAKKREHTFVAHAPGAFWWRLLDAKGKTKSEVNRFDLQPASPPVLIHPQMDAIVLAPPDRGLVFTWSHVQGCSKYRIEVARDEKFATVASESVDGPQLWVGHGIEEGTFFWRVRVERCGNNPPRSSPGRFRLITKPLLEAPTTLDAEVIEK